MLRDGLLPRRACAGARRPPPSSIGKRGIRRYGYDGLAFESVIDALPAVDERAARGKAIVVHVSDGASLCALDGGRKVAMATGFDDLDGLLGTRTRRLDPDVVSHLVAELRMAPAVSGPSSGSRRNCLACPGLPVLSTASSAARSRARDRRRIPPVPHQPRVECSPPHCPAWTPSCSPQVLAPMRYPSAAESAAAPRGWASTSTRRRTKRAGHGLTRPGSRVTAWVVPTDKRLLVARRTQAVVG